MQERTDQEWVRLLKQDDPQAVSDLWEWLYIRGLNLARRYRQEPDIGSEATIAAYLRIQRRGVYQFKFDCPFLGYCHVILVREVLRLINKSKKKRSEIELDDEVLKDEPVEVVDRGAIWRRLQPCMKPLLSRQRKVLILRYLQKYTPQSVADQLGITRNHVNQIAHTARRKLHDCLQRRGYQSIDDML